MSKEKALQFIEEKKEHYVDFVNGIKTEGFTVSPENAKKSIEIAIIPNWIKCSKEMPAIKKVCFAFGINEYKHKRILRAIFVPKYSVSVDDMDYEGDSDYHEEKDEFFWPEGWYEWNENDEIHMKISFEITDWMPIVDYPSYR